MSKTIRLLSANEVKLLSILSVKLFQVGCINYQGHAKFVNIKQKCQLLPERGNFDAPNCKTKSWPRILTIVKLGCKWLIWHNSDISRESSRRKYTLLRDAGTRCLLHTEHPRLSTSKGLSSNKACLLSQNKDTARFKAQWQRVVGDTTACQLSS